MTWLTVSLMTQNGRHKASANGAGALWDLNMEAPFQNGQMEPIAFYLTPRFRSISDILSI